MIDAKLIGERIAKFRKNKRLTQTELAEKLLVSPKTVSKWEKGHGVPNIETLPMLAEFFNTTIDEILSGTPQKTRRLEVWTHMNTQSEKTEWIFPTIEDFPEEMREAILMHFLMEYAKVNNIDFVKLITGIAAINKPENNEMAVERVLNLEQVSIARIQKTLSIGFSKGARIIEGLEAAGLIARKNMNTFEWVRKDKNVVNEIIKNYYN